MDSGTPKKTYRATDITFHGRTLRPTQEFEKSIWVNTDGSIQGRVYGIPRFILDPKTMLIYMGYQFSPEITEKFIDGTIEMPKGVQIVLDKVAQERLEAKRKAELKNSTRVWHKPE